jgi:hypothetical protein
MGRFTVALCSSSKTKNPCRPDAYLPKCALLPKQNVTQQANSWLPRHINRWQGKDITDKKSHILFYIGKEKGHHSVGVAFVVHRSMKRNVLDTKTVDDRICILRIKTKFHNQSFINVHAPTEDKDEIDVEAFHQKMEEAYDICPSNDIKVLLGTLMPQSGQKKFSED